MIDGLVGDSRRRMDAMLEAEGSPAKPAPINPYLESLRERNERDRLS